MKKKIFFLSISFLLCLKCDGPISYFDIYNNTLETVNVEGKLIAHGVKSFKIPSGEQGEGFGGVGAKKT